jgi:hypothetical protein
VFWKIRALHQAKQKMLKVIVVFVFLVLIAPGKVENFFFSHRSVGFFTAILLINASKPLYATKSRLK